jgi:4-amino-4-deoxy-L-arabinose transferase-like glycosyltransferase
MQRHSSIKLDLLMGGALTLVGALTRIPYLALIPLFSDEVRQTIEALNIRPGGFMPLVGYDSYSGPMFAYLMAVCLRLFGITPIAPRIVVMVMGALTVGMTYWLARAMGLRWPWAALVGLMMAANPYHILISSHYAGTSFVIPLFSTAFLAALVVAVRRGSGLWLIAAGALLGLALQTNPVVALIVPGVLVWYLIQLIHPGQPAKAGIGLRTRWPYLAVVAFCVIYAPVIVQNVETGMAAVREAKRQVYVWQGNPSLSAYTQNMSMLVLQLGHQVSGALAQRISPSDLRGLPLVICVWAVAGLVYAPLTRRGLSLVTLAVGSQVLIMPWVSNYYGEPYTTRFTNQLTPLILVGMGALAMDVWAWARARTCAHVSASPRPERPGPLAFAFGALLVAISLWPLVPLFRYYDQQVAAGRTNAPYFVSFDEFKRRWHGEKIFVTDSLPGCMVARYFFAIYGIPYDLAPVGRIFEHLAAGHETGSVIVILHVDEMARPEQQADLLPWHSAALDAGYKIGDYGIYTIADAQQVRKPSFVFTATNLVPTVLPLQVNFADQLSLIGYELKSKATPGANLDIMAYWQAMAPMSDFYIGFVHLLGPEGGLVTQDDHELGRDFYSTVSWLPGEVIREKFVLALPNDMAVGDYELRAGVYPIYRPNRLAVQASDVPSQNDEVTLGTVHVGP